MMQSFYLLNKKYYCAITVIISRQLSSPACEFNEKKSDNYNNPQRRLRPPIAAVLELLYWSCWLYNKSIQHSLYTVSTHTLPAVSDCPAAE